MDFQRFGIDARLAEAAERLGIIPFFYETMLSHAVEKQENICAKLALDKGREEVLLLPALQWMLTGESRKVLVVVNDAASGERCALAIERLGSGAGIETCLVDHASLAEGAPASPVFDGDPSSSVVIGRLSDLIVACPPLDLKEYGFLVVDGVDRLAEFPSDSVRKFIAALSPSWERRTVLACAKLSAKAKNLAWDLADNPVEISIDSEVLKVQSVAKETWNVPGESKLKFLLGLIEREKPARICVFCNLKDTAEEVSRRLQANGLGSDYLLGALAIERKLAVLDKVISGKCLCLVLTDQGAEGLEGGAFPLVVNYDIPLEPELFVKRIEMLDRNDPSAKVVSLACDRYIYGLPAVESYIDDKLDAVPADESLLSAVDKSEGLNADRRAHGGEDSRREDNRSREDNRIREDNRSREDARNTQNRGGGRSGGQSRPRRDANRLHDSPREDRSPDIRKSISEATGGSLEMGGNYPPPLKPRGQGETQGRQQGRKPEGSRGDNRRGSGDRNHDRDHGKNTAQRGQAPRESDPRSSAKPVPSNKPNRPNRGPSKKAPPKADNVSTRNPYDMPIEERMKRYREKYGQGLEGEGTKRQSGPQGPQKAKPRQDTVPSVPSRKPQGMPPEKKPEGLLGRLFGTLKKKNI